MFQAKRNRGFTLVELLVVIAIIGILIALLLPAIQAAREAARRMECQNHLKQIALGCLNYESSLHYFPSGGWGWNWVGDPDQGFGKRQPGGWEFNILPYVDMKSIFNMAKGQQVPAKKTLTTTMVATPIGLFNCPTKRASVVYPWNYSYWGNNYAAEEMDPPVGAARSDYAINAGCSIDQWGGGPGSYAEGQSTTYGWPDLGFTGVNGIDHGLDGVSYMRSTIKLREVTDGLSHTYLVGERYLNPDYYKNGLSGNDNESMYTGFDNDNFTVAGWGDNCIPPHRDRVGYDTVGFGSAHPASWNASFCDGSVHSISYDIDQVLHSYLANRRDKNAVPADAIGR
jgi:prepilin-type N-terminal cleavage/methylation domain-containing protein